MNMDLKSLNKEDAKIVVRHYSICVQGASSTDSRTKIAHSQLGFITPCSVRVEGSMAGVINLARTSDWLSSAAASC